ncbi:MAG: GMC oxidoreductase, partial [Pseudomonadales bacterium]|nr:GMC oxidoreductase [Pseudomonadales bacterium]
LRSGIGAAARLAEAGVTPRVELPGVGENLMDHLELYVQQACTQPVSLNGRLTRFGKALIGARWLLRRDGLGASNHFEAGGFVRSAAGVAWPDIQFHFLPAAVRYDGRDAGTRHGFQAHVGPMRPESRGRLRLRGPRLADAPSIRFDYLAAEADREVFRRALRLTRELFAAAPLDPFRGEELAPGAAAQSDAELDAFVRAKAESAYHPCGTCAMGTGPTAVVDPECRVHGVRGLRVIDSSVFPDIPNGNLNAPTTMLADRTSDLVRGRPVLEPEPLPYFLDPAWPDRQRTNLNS